MEFSSVDSPPREGQEPSEAADGHRWRGIRVRGLEGWQQDGVARRMLEHRQQLVMTTSGWASGQIRGRRRLEVEESTSLFDSDRTARKTDSEIFFRQW